MLEFGDKPDHHRERRQGAAGGVSHVDMAGCSCCRPGGPQLILSCAGADPSLPGDGWR